MWTGYKVSNEDANSGVYGTKKPYPLDWHQLAWLIIDRDQIWYEMIL